MQELTNPIEFETTFRTYTATGIIGEGGAGRVFAAQDDDGGHVAIKVLTASNKDKRKRFKNELGFLQKTSHVNLVQVVDHGLSTAKGIAGPFYVMPRYDGSLRDLLDEGIAPGDVIALFGQLLNGIEAAHFLGAVHRDLKPENVLFRRQSGRPILAVADFGVARFLPEAQETLVETRNTRLANFVYSAPEQRQPGQQVGIPADIYALGLILNEMFTGVVPHGSGFKRIADAHAEYGYLDAVVDAMMQHSLQSRLGSVEQVKQRMRLDHEEAMLKQRLSAEQNTVVVDTEVDDPLVTQPIRIVGVDWDRDELELILSQPVNAEWIDTFRSLGDYTCVMGTEPYRFTITGNVAHVRASESSAQQVINYVKEWLPRVTRNYRDLILRRQREAAQQQTKVLREQRERDEARLRVLGSLKI